MNRNIVSILDINNKYLPFWEIGGLNKRELTIFYTIIVAFWVFIYYTNALRYKTSVVVGLFSALLFTFIYNYIYNTPYCNVINTNDKKWYSGYSNKDPMIMSIDKLRSMKYTDITKNGYMVTDKFFKTLKKENTVTPLYKNFILDKYKQRHNSFDSDITTLLTYRSNEIAYQGYCLVTILFTILSIAYSYNKTLFGNVFNMFVYSLIFSIPFIFTWVTLYKNKEMIDLTSIKVQFMFIAVSITLSIITEVLVDSM